MKTILPTYPEEINDITEQDLTKCKYAQHRKELEVMEQKCLAVANMFSFKDYSHEVIFKDAFIKGYLTAFIVSEEEEKIKNSITPLGQALAE